jgi:hypothetical protein
MQVQACNTVPPHHGDWGIIGKAGASLVPWTFTGTSGTVLTVTDNWSVAYSASFDISCGGLPLGSGQQVSNVTIAVNGSTLDSTTHVLVNGSSTLIFSYVWTSCGIGPPASTTPATFLVSYTIALHHGDTYEFDSEVRATADAAITPSPPLSTPAYTDSTSVDLEPSTYSTTLISIVAQ